MCFVSLVSSPQTLNLCSKCYKDGKLYVQWLSPRADFVHVLRSIGFERRQTKPTKEGGGTWTDLALSIISFSDSFFSFMLSSFISFHVILSELQKNGRTEDKTASIMRSKTEVETLNRSGSKQGSGVQIDKADNQRGLSSPKCMKTESESTAVGSSSQERDSNKEQEIGSSGAAAEDAPLQKKRKRCWTCKAKLELAQRELGNCRCSKYIVLARVR